MSFWPSPFTLAQTEIWINNNIKRYSELGFGRWAIILTGIKVWPLKLQRPVATTPLIV